MNLALDTDTIVAIATAPGRAGIGVVRLSGPRALEIASTLTRTHGPLEPRQATYTSFYDHAGERLDNGLVIGFAGPASFTGEDVAELQGHGSPLVLNELIDSAVRLGARLARPGEFSERAYLNGKLDLAQAEAVADLINASSSASARAALRSLQGEFSRRLNALATDLLALRVQVEAAIDFPDEDIELLAAPEIREALDRLLEQTDSVVRQTATAVRLNEGARVVLIGAPNVGKSSVLNRLCGEDRAIVSAVAGTTRDVLREQLSIKGIPVELVDTAGLRESDDETEAEGIRRAKQQADQADLVLAVHDVTDAGSRRYIEDWLATPTESPKRTVGNTSLGAAPLSSQVFIANKIDLLPDEHPQKSPGKMAPASQQALTYGFSAKTGAGAEELTEHLVECLTGASSAGLEHTFSARSRHLLALRETRQELANGQAALASGEGAELVAEHLRLAHHELGSVCGEVTTDELLGEIFFRLLYREIVAGGWQRPLYSRP